MCRHTACAQWKPHALMLTSLNFFSTGLPQPDLKIHGHPLHLRFASEELQDSLEDLLVHLLCLPRHEAIEKGNLFAAVARPHEAVDGEQLVKGVTYQLEGTVHIPVLAVL